MKYKTYISYAQGWISPTIAIVVYIFDQIYRVIKRTRLRVMTLEALPFPGRATFLRLQLDKRKLDINPCDYILLNCPAISKIEWHPFTVTQVILSNCLPWRWSIIYIIFLFSVHQRMIYHLPF